MGQADCRAHAFTLETSVKRRFLRGEFPAIVQELESVPEIMLFEMPTVGIHMVTALVYEKRFKQAHVLMQHWLSHLRQAPRQAALHGEWLSSRFAAIYVLMQIFSGELSMISAARFFQLRQMLDVPGTHQPMMNALYAYLLHMNGKHDRAMTAARTAMMQAFEAEDHYVHAIATLLKCLCVRAMGDSLQATRIINSAMDDARSYQDSPAWAVLALAKAKLSYEQDDLDVADALLDRALPVLTFSAVCDFKAHALLTRSRIQTIRGEYEDAVHTLDHLRQSICNSSDQRWIDYLHHEHVRISILEHGIPSSGLLHREDVACDDVSRSRYCPAVGQVALRSALLKALHRNDLAGADMVLGQLANIALLQNDAHLHLLVLVGRAALELRRGHRDMAVLFLNQALRMAERTGLYRTLFDDTLDFSKLFAMALEAGWIEDDIDASMLQRLQTQTFLHCATVSTSSDPRRALNPPLESLTDTELKVLELLSEGLSNKEISLRSGMALTTTKWHLKNIFGKLAASNRTGAVLKAQSMNLIN